MLNQLVDAIRPGASRLEAQLTEAETALAQKRSTLNALLIDGQIDGPAAAKAADAVDSAEKRTRNLRSALAAAQEREQAAAVETEREAKRSAWQAAVKAAEARHTAVEKLAGTMERFASDYLAALQANQALADALPANPDSIGNATDRADFETRLRKELARLGLAFVFPWPFGSVSLPPLMPQFQDILELVRRSVPTDAQ